MFVRVGKLCDLVAIPKSRSTGLKPKLFEIVLKVIGVAIPKSRSTGLKHSNQIGIAQALNCRNPQIPVYGTETGVHRHRPHAG